MRSPLLKLAIVGSAMLLAGQLARGQQTEQGPSLGAPIPNSLGFLPPLQPEPGPAPKEPERVIHSDLPPAEGAHEPPNDAYRFWVRADAWLAWIKHDNFPPLVTVGATSQARPGALGQDGTMVRFGGQVDPHERFGGQFELGGWLDCDHCIGVSLGFAFLGSRNVFFELSSPGTPAIARPFFDVNSQQQDASLISYPGLAAGSVTVSSGTSLYGFDATTLLTMNCSKDYPLRFLFGLRYLYLHDDLEINESVQVDPSSSVFPGQHIAVQDLFDCNNYFYGAHVGFSAGYNVRRLELQATAKCALGVTQECVGIAGFTHFDGPGGATQPAGLLALSTNSGTHVRDAFAVVPEVDLDARFEVTKHIVVTAGWSFLYWSRVARAGLQPNLNINPDLVPTSANYGQPIVNHQPLPAVVDTDFWMHAAHIGLELRF